MSPSGVKTYRKIDCGYTLEPPCFRDADIDINLFAHDIYNVLDYKYFKNVTVSTFIAQRFSFL